MQNILKQLTFQSIRISRSLQNTTFAPFIRSLSSKMTEKYVYPKTRRDLTVTDDFHGITVTKIFVEISSMNYKNMYIQI